MILILKHFLVILFLGIVVCAVNIPITSTNLEFEICEEFVISPKVAEIDDFPMKSSVLEDNACSFIESSVVEDNCRLYCSNFDDITYESNSSAENFVAGTLLLPESSGG